MSGCNSTKGVSNNLNFDVYEKGENIFAQELIGKDYNLLQTTLANNSTHSSSLLSHTCRCDLDVFTSGNTSAWITSWCCLCLLLSLSMNHTLITSHPAMSLVSSHLSIPSSRCKHNHMLTVLVLQHALPLMCSTRDCHRTHSQKHSGASRGTRVVTRAHFTFKAVLHIPYFSGTKGPFSMFVIILFSMFIPCLVRMCFGSLIS